MKYAELTAKLLRLGCRFTWHGAGSHEIWRNPATGKQTSWEALERLRLPDLANPANFARVRAACSDPANVR
jgi:hypothetical protein